MKLLTLAAAISLAAALAGCGRNTPNPTPAPKTSAATPATSSTSGAGGSAPVQSSVNNGAGNREDNRNGGNPVSQQIDPNHANQHRDFQENGDAAGPKSADTAPTTRNK